MQEGAVGKVVRDRGTLINILIDMYFIVGFSVPLDSKWFLYLWSDN